MPQNTPHLKIREAARADSQEVAELVELAFAPLRCVYRPTPEATAAQSLSRCHGIRLVAISDTRIVGTLEIDIHKDRFHIVGLAVHPRFQRRGIARRMVDSVTARAKRTGQKRITLNTIRETGNVSVFERLGFHVVSEETAKWCESERYTVLHDVRMELPLTPG